MGPLTNPNPAACCPRRPLSGTYVTLAVSEKKHRLNRMPVRRTVHVRARRQCDASRGAPAVPPCVNPPRVRAANTAATTLRAPGVSWGTCTCMPDAKRREPRPCTCCTASVWCVYFLGVHMRCRLCHLHPLSPPASCSPRPDCAQLLRRRRPSQGRHIMWCVRLIHRRYGRCRPLWWL